MSPLGEGDWWIMMVLQSNERAVSVMHITALQPDQTSNISRVVYIKFLVGLPR